MDDTSNRWFFDPPAFIPTSPEESKAYQKAVNENKQIWNRTGYRGLVQRLIKSGYFTKPDMSPIESVMTARFEEVIKYVSIENAMQ